MTAMPRMSTVSVVVATYNRRARVEELLAALAEQTLPTSGFEVVIVDDASHDGTEGALAEEAGRGRIRLRAIRRHRRSGPAGAREDGWRVASGDVIAFTDDDCVPQPGWLVAGLEAVEANPGAIVQGRTEPAPWERGDMGPFSRTIDVPALDPAFQTCNVFYPRALLERVGGFDTEAFGRAPGGEDSDLAWRAIESGAGGVFARDALVYHAVNQLGPVGGLRVAARWTTPMLAYVRHAELRRAAFVKGVFWKGSHYLLVRLLIAVALPRRLRWLGGWLAFPYLRAAAQRARASGASWLLVPYIALHDLVELVAVLRAAIRYRRPML